MTLREKYDINLGLVAHLRASQQATRRLLLKQRAQQKSGDEQRQRQGYDGPQPVLPIERDPGQDSNTHKPPLRTRPRGGARQPRPMRRGTGRRR